MDEDFLYESLAKEVWITIHKGKHKGQFWVLFQILILQWEFSLSLGLAKETAQTCEMSIY